MHRAARLTPQILTQVYEIEISSWLIKAVRGSLLLLPWLSCSSLSLCWVQVSHVEDDESPL